MSHSVNKNGHLWDGLLHAIYQAEFKWPTCCLEPPRPIRFYSPIFPFFRTRDDLFKPFTFDGGRESTAIRFRGHRCLQGIRTQANVGRATVIVSDFDHSNQNLRWVLYVKVIAKDCTILKSLCPAPELWPKHPIPCPVSGQTNLPEIKKRCVCYS